VTIRWGERPAEERYTLNPAMTAHVIAQATAGYMRETNEGMPFALSYLAVPIILHAETREQLPPTVATSMASWLADNELLRRSIQSRAPAFVPLVQEGLLIGLATTALTLDGSMLRVRNPTAVVPRQDLPELHRLLRAARHLGRLFGRVRSPVTLFALWGVRP
jgi:Family of unknown function (DUF6521)